MILLLTLKTQHSKLKVVRADLKPAIYRGNSKLKVVRADLKPAIYRGNSKLKVVRADLKPAIYRENSKLKVVRADLKPAIYRGNSKLKTQNSTFKTQNSMTVTVLIPTPLQKFTQDQASLSVEATSVQEMLDALEKACPGIQERICDEQGKLRRFLNVYVNSEDIRFLEGQTTPLGDGDEVSIVPAVAGG